MFYKLKYIGVSFVLLSGASIYSQGLSAIDIEHEAGRGPARPHLAKFINGQYKVRSDEVSSWVSHSFRWLEHLYDTAGDMKERAKAVLGFAHLSSHYRSTPFPEMDSVASTRYSLSLLQNIIDADSWLDEDGDFKRYRNHARVFWGELAVYNLNGYASDDELSAAWGFLEEIGGRFTKIGKVYQAELLLNRGFRPTGVEDGDVIGLAGKLLSESYSSPRTASLISQVRSRPQTSSSEEVEDEEVIAQPGNLHSRKARRVRERLENQVTRELNVRASGVQSEEEITEPARKKQRIQGEDSEESFASALVEVMEAKSDSESLSRSSEPPGRNRKNREVRSWMTWSDEQVEKFITLWNSEVKGKVLNTAIWETMSEDQKKAFSGYQDKKFIKALSNKRITLGLTVRQNHQMISDAEYDQFLNLHSSKLQRRDILNQMRISRNRYQVLFNKAKKEGKI